MARRLAFAARAGRVTDTGMQVLFDLDGTLTDPREGIVNCIRHALSALKIEIDEGIDLTSFIGPPLRDTFRTLCADDEIAETAVAVYRQRFSTIGLFENRLYDGIETCLQALVDAGVSNYVVTSKPTLYSRRIVEHFGLNEYFKVVYGSNLDGSLADKTQLIRHVIETENIAATDAVMIGDRKFDVIGANNHGMRCIGVLWGYGSERELRDAGALSLCRRPGELQEHIFAP